ncbi:D-alanyl-D-alanine carboxypeptidase/D-alanyl-D-alanine-endopeptidase [Agromyces sp. SYSU T00266]|uniref:D-alanyl-D-alanine carboxypeptidase/D-alanyl-D-alanine-endopeptidase n=1 Tax=Agromyces zhanjiangensis TaxID=3158562 RepID=UPI003393B86E
MSDETDAVGATSAQGEPASPGDPAAARSPRDPDAATTPGRPRGIRSLIAEHRVLAAVAAVAAVGLLGGAVAFAATMTGGEASPTPSATPTPTPTDTPTPTPTATPTPTPEPAARVRTCSVAGLAADPRLANLQAQVMNAETGEVLLDRGGLEASRTASVMKVVTAAAALAVFSPDDRFATTVVKGAEPGSVVLVGGGDLTLSRTATGNETVYPGAAHLDDLAAQVRAAWDADPSNPPLTKLVLDASYFGGETWHASWAPTERDLGYMPEITALMVDGDRDDPYANTSRRGADAVGRAGDAFAAALGGVSAIERGTAPGGATELGRVWSPTVAQLIDKSLVVSDNTVAEMLARQVAIAVGTGNTFEAIDPAVRQALESYGIARGGIHVVDGSGLSPDNAVPPAYLTRLFAKVEAREGNLGVIRDGLPIAGQRGSLSYADRFAGDNAAAHGAVFAKTGWIDTGYTLGGIIHAQDGTTLTFAIYALGDVSQITADAKVAIDTLTTGFYRCGDELSNE